MISFIVPVYNIEDYLTPCLKSIACQTGEWECILIDDGSSDGSGKKCDIYAAEDPRFRVIHQENKGVNTARKRGLAEAKGDFVWFVDGDDLIHPQALEILEKYLNDQNDIYFFSELQGRIPSFVSLPENIEVAKYDHEKKKELPVLNFHTVVFRRDFILNQDFPPFSIGEDLLFVMQQMARANAVVQLKNMHLYFYLIREGSAMTAPTFQKMQSVMDCNAAIVKFLCSAEGSVLSRSHVRRFVKQLYWRNAAEISHFHKDERKILLRRWRDCLNLLPTESLTKKEKLLNRFYGFLPTGLCQNVQGFVYCVYAKILTIKH